MKRNKFLAIMLIAGLLLASIAAGALTSKVIFTVQTQYTGSTGLGLISESLNLDYSISLTNGAGANQANVIYNASGSLVDDANEVLNFYSSGTLEDAFGNPLTIEKLKLLIICNTSTEATLKIGGGTAAMNLFVDATDILALPPGGKFLYSAPDATGLDIKTDTDLNLLHGGEGTANLVYKIIAIGVD